MQTQPLENVVEGLFRWKFAGAEFDEARWELSANGVIQDLERKPLEVLGVLLRHAGEVVTKEELFEAVWPAVIVVEGALTNAISKLRKAIGDEAQSVITTAPKMGYRLAGKVERRVVAPAHPSVQSLRPGEAVPRREHWRLVERLDLSDSSEVWRAEHAKTREPRIFKFSPDGARLQALKREATLSRLLSEALGARRDFSRVLEWNFEDAPFFLECEYGGLDFNRWAESVGGLAAIATADRLRLMTETVEAVAAAHSVGVLHKDLKPANVLVWNDDTGQPRARLTDFGSARLLEPAQLQKLGITRLGLTQTQSESLTGTPLYLAPEVVAGQVPTVQSDVYALGVMLYQILAGDFRKPMAPGWEADIADELLREDIAAAANGNPALRLSGAAELALRLRTLETRRVQRTEAQSAQGRAEAAERALARTRARRPWLVATGIALLSGLGLSSYSFWQASVARDAAVREGDLARAVENFLKSDFIDAANPTVSGRKDVTVVEAAEQAATVIDTRFASRPDLAGRLHWTLAQAFGQLLRYDDAEREYRKGIATLASAGVKEDVQRASLYVGLVGCLAHASKLDEAGTALAEMKLQTAASAQDPAVAWIVASAEGTMSTYRMDPKQGLADFSRAYDLARSTTVSAESLANLRVNLVDRYIAVGKFDEALGIAVPLEADLTRIHGARHLTTLRVTRSIGTVLMYQGKFAEALPRLERAYEGQKAVLGADAESTLDSLELVAQAHFQHGEFDQAAQAEGEVYRSVKRTRGDSHMRTHMTLANYSETLAAAGRAQEAAALYEAELASHPKIPPALLTYMHFNYAGTLVKANRHREALAQLDGVTPEELKKAIPYDDFPGRLALVRAQALHGLKRDAEALTQVKAAISDATAHPTPDGPGPEANKLLAELTQRGG